MDMNHADIENHDLVRRYVLGQLAADEAERFESHYLDCARCQQDIETFEAMRAGFTGLAATSVATRRILPRPSRGPVQFALAAVVAALAVVPVWLVLNETPVSSPAPPPPPVAGLQILPVTQLRSSAETPQAVIRPADGKPFILMIELDWPDQPAYDVRIVGANGDSVWQGSGLEPNYLDALAVNIPAGFLAPGVYRAEVSAGERTIGSFPFEVLSPR